MQQTYCGADYEWKWTDDWYKWDRTAGNRAALKARNADVERLVSYGYTVRKFSLGDQLISRGGIGSDKPHIEVWAKVYGYDYW